MLDVLSRAIAGGAVTLERELRQLQQGRHAEEQQQQEQRGQQRSSTSTGSHPQPMQRLPSLVSLSVGWGFSCGALHLLAASSPCLTRLRAGVGAEVTDALLRQLPVTCPHLQVRLSWLGTVTCHTRQACMHDHCAGPVLLCCTQLAQPRSNINNRACG